MTEIVLNVSGMTCGHCAKTVERSVRSLPGVVAARVDFAKKELTAAVDGDQVDVDAIAGAVERAGYRAVVPGRGAQ